MLAVLSRAPLAPADVLSGKRGNLEEAKQLPEPWRQGGTELNSVGPLLPTHGNSVNPRAGVELLCLCEQINTNNHQLH